MGNNDQQCKESKKKKQKLRLGSGGLLMAVTFRTGPDFGD